MGRFVHIVGLAVSPILHGFYDWFASTEQISAAAMIAGFSFMLFYAYISKLNILISQYAALSSEQAT